MKEITETTTRYLCSGCGRRFDLREDCERHEHVCRTEPSNTFTCWRIVLEFHPTCYADDPLSAFSFLPTAVGMQFVARYSEDQRFVMPYSISHKWGVERFPYFGSILGNSLVTSEYRIPERDNSNISYTYIRNGSDFQIAQAEWLEYYRRIAQERITFFDKLQKIQELPRWTPCKG